LFKTFLQKNPSKKKKNTGHPREGAGREAE
jgi:hypothetical protein